MELHRVGHDWSDLAAAAEEVKYTFITTHIWSPASRAHLQLLSAKSLQLGCTWSLLIFLLWSFSTPLPAFQSQQKCQRCWLTPLKEQVSGLCLFSSGCESCSVVSNSLRPHGILQARILEWVAYPYSRGSSRPGIKPGSPALQANCLPTELWGKLVFSYFHRTWGRQNSVENRQLAAAVSYALGWTPLN